MAQYQNLTGTTSKTFKIGKFGTTLSIGTVNLYDTAVQYLQSDTALLTNKVLLDATGNTYIDSSNYTGNANTANKLKKAINFQITGGATSDSVNSDLSQNVTLTISSLDATKLNGNIAWANVSSLAGTTENSFALGNHNHNSLYAPINASLNFVGNVTGSGAMNSDITLNIADGAVTNEKVVSIVPSKIVGAKGNTTIGSSTNVINLYGKSNTSGEADYAKNLKSSADHAIVIQTANTTSFLSPGSSGELLQTTGAGNNPSWVSPSSLTVSHASTAGALSNTVSAGSENLPVYFKNGLPVQTSTTLNVSITGNASTATKANSATYITNAKGTASYTYSTIEDLISNTARKVQVGSSGTQYSASNNIITIPAYTEGATKVEGSSINGKVKINGVDTVVYNDSDLVAKVSTNATNITTVSNNLTSHVTNVSNPHNVTKAQVGLGSVVNKPQTSTATDISGATSTGTTASYYTRAYDVKTYLENTLKSDLTLGGNVNVNGNLTVKGSTITLDAQNLAISDQLLELYKRDNGTVPLNGYAGIYVNNYSGEDNNKIEGLFVDSSVNAYVGTATISGNTLSNASMKKLATESYVTTQLSNNEEVEILDIDIAEDSTASTLVKRTSGGLINANTPTNASASTSVINLDYLGKVDKVLTPNANNTIDIGTATKAYKTVYVNKIQSANSSTLTLSGSSGIVINNNVSPNATNTLNFGSTDKQWNNIYGKVLYENGTALSAIYQPKGEYLTATDISNKLDKSTSASKVYGTDSSGNQTMYSFGTAKTGNTLVYRDASGNFSANVITATLSGNASTATKAERDSQGNVISSTYFKNTGGILTNVSTASSNKNFSINSYTYAGSVNGIIDYVATSTGNSLHLGGNSADNDDRGIQKLEFTVTDGQESTSKTPIITLTKGNINVYANTNISVGSNVNIGSSTNKVNSIYTDNLYLNGKDVSNFYNSLQDTTGTVQTGTHNSTTVISEITDSNGTLQYKKVKLPAESNNRVTQTLVSDNKDYNLLFTSASTTTAQASTQFNTGIKVNPNTGTIKATVFSGRATSAENIYVDSSTSIAASTIKSAIDKVEGATSFPDANTIVYRNADKSTSITKLYTNEIHPITTKDTLTIEGKASEAGDADIAKAVYNNGASTNALTFSTEAAYTNSDAHILVQAPSTNVVKHSTIKSLIDTVNVAYQNGTYADMTVGEATHASTATTATKADSLKHETALSGVSYRLALSQSDAAGYYAPRISDISVKGSVITATLSGNATSASTATNISGGAVNSLVYQTTTGVTGFISYPTDVSTTNEYILTAKKVNTSNTISWIKSPYVKKSGDTITGKLTIQSGDPSGCLQLGADVSSNTLTAGTRKLARLTFPTREYGTTKTCSIMSCDNMNNYNYVEFGGHIGDATNTAPDYMCFNVDKTHNSLSPTTKECVMAISPTSLRLFSGALDAGQITRFDDISSKWVFNNANTFKNSGYTYTLPNKTGIIALSDDIPTKVSQLENDSKFTSNIGTITEIKVNGVSKGTSGSVNLNNMVTYSSSQTATVAGVSKTTYRYNQPTGDNDTGNSNGSAYFPEGIIMGGTAGSAGLITRGICGVTTPDATTGACTKENLFLNFDGNLGTGFPYNSNRQVIIQAAEPGKHYGNNLYQFAAARGDAVKGYCDNTYAAKSHTHNYAASDTAGGPANSVKNALTIGSKSYNGSAATSISTQDVIGTNKITIGGKIYDGSAAVSVSTQDVIGANKITFGTKVYDGSEPVTFETTDLGIEDIGSAELNTLWNEVFA